jgi:hypothetical protein
MIERISLEALMEIEIMEAFGDLRSSRLMDLYRQLEKANRILDNNSKARK